jgi:hypothetical protein
LPGKIIIPYPLLQPRAYNMLRILRFLSSI